ncbi:MAG TPA: NmrA family NAD(P)-binding protein [Chitinivibrionales bacterium]|nr:NmrA family NAD(P)-binding protein [Chitinivibrionales bacterium]
MIVITGASGKTGSRTAELLLLKKKEIRVVGRNADHLKVLESKGAEVMTGDQADVGFLTKAFAKAKSVYLIVPPKYDSDDYRAYYNAIGDAAVAAIRKSGVRKVVFLSSLGAELDSGTGPVLGLHDVESKLNTLRKVDTVAIRAGFMMENILWSIDMIKNKKMLGDSIDPEVPIHLVAARDIGEKAAELLERPRFKGHTVIELFGDQLTYKEAAKIVGEKLGIPDLPYARVSDNDARTSMTAMGVSKHVADLFVEMSESMNAGKLSPVKAASDKPNAPTRFAMFVEEVLAPAYRAAVKPAA